MAFVNVEGEVSRVHSSGNGFGLKESWTAQGKDKSRYWAVFPKEGVLVAVGDRVKVSGGLQTSVTDPKPDSQGVDRVYVDHVVGQAKVEVVQASQGGQGGFTGGPAPSGPQDRFGGAGGDFPEQPF